MPGLRSERGPSLRLRPMSSELPQQLRAPSAAVWSGFLIFRALKNYYYFFFLGDCQTQVLFVSSFSGGESDTGSCCGWLRNPFAPLFEAMIEGIVCWYLEGNQHSGCLRWFSISSIHSRTLKLPSKMGWFEPMVGFLWGVRGSSLSFSGIQAPPSRACQNLPGRLK